MYIPKDNLITDRNEIMAFMKNYSFATLISVHKNYPTATHLPFTVSQQDDDVILTSHMAKSNKQWQQIENHRVLVIFTEPHAYISPTHYENKISVPTWNYISVHAYGKAEIITDAAEAFETLDHMVETYEKSYAESWKTFPADYKQKMLNGIVPFSIRVTDLQAKKKLSQNKKEIERERIIATLEKSPNTNEQLIGQFMKEL